MSQSSTNNIDEDAKNFIKDYIDKIFNNYNIKLQKLNDVLQNDIASKFNIAKGAFDNELKSTFSSHKASMASLEKQTEQKIESAIKLKSTEVDNTLKDFKEEFSKHVSINDSDIRDLLEECQIEFTENETKRKEKFENIQNQILDLLPEASAVGLSESFKDTAMKHRDELERCKKAYINTLIAMLLVPFIAYLSGMLPGFFVATITFEQFCYSACRLFAIDLPLLLIAGYFSKQMHHHFRMLAEYTYKYTTAMTFVGMSKEAKEKPELFGSEHIKDLTTGFRDAIYNNPSIHLDKTPPSSTPLETISGLVEKIGSEAVKAIVDQVKK